MKNTLKVLAASLVLGLAGFAFAEGTITETTGIGSPARVSYDWVAGTNLTYSGSVAGNVDSYLRGTIERVTIQSVSTSAVYNAYLYDMNNVDLLAGGGVGLASNTVYSFTPAITMKAFAATNIHPMAVNDLPRLFVTNIGPSSAGSIDIYIR